MDGYLLDKNDEPTETQVIDVEKLRENEELFDFETEELWEAKDKWVKSILEKDFPQDSGLFLSFKTQ